LTQHFGSMAALAEASEEDLAAVDGVGPTIAASVAAWLKDRRSRRLIKKLDKAGVRMTASRGATRSGPLAGQQFVVTGRLESMSRNQAEGALKGLGASIGSSVTKKTTTLVAGEAAGSKLARAEALETPIWDEERLLALLSEHGAEELDRV